MTWDQATTRKPDGPNFERRQREVPVLTVMGHPELERLGERAWLMELPAGSSVEVCRTTPDFAQPHRVWGRSLEDPYLSREPFFLRPSQGGGLLLDPGRCPTPITLEGHIVQEEHQISSARLNTGVVIELADRVALLLHHLPTAHREESPCSDDALVGASLGIRQLRDQIDRVADLEVSVLLRGESGTGKELAAQTLHRCSRRGKAPFVAVNLGALPPNLAAAELFGSVQGAFTGAVKSREGYFRAANGGTLFLDEVGEAPLEVQAMLLRVLETGEIFPVGSQRPHQVDVRLIAATDANLEKRVDEGGFKEPLLHRLSAYEIWLPPLRERRDDIGRLFLHFAHLESKMLGDKRPWHGVGDTPWCPARLAARLATYPWPGNVRQLHNVVRQLLIDSRGDNHLAVSPRVEHLLVNAKERSPTVSQSGGQEIAAPIRRRPAEIGAEELEETLRAHRFEPAAAARELGISRPSIYYLIQQHPHLQTARDLDDEEIEEALSASNGHVATAAQRLQVSARALRRRLKEL